MIASMFVGGFLVWFGMVGGAIAARVRGRIPARERAKPRKLATRRRDEIAAAPLASDVRDALVGLGYKPAAAAFAAARVRSELGDDAPLEQALRRALQVVAKDATA